MNKLLSEVVSIKRQFQRSVHIDADLGNVDALKGYICQGTAKTVLDNTARQILNTKQMAFTWTGPYGGGKSSLALNLCSLVHADEKIRTIALSSLELNNSSPVVEVFNVIRGPWSILPVVGKRASVVESIYEAYLKFKGIQESNLKINPKSLLKILINEVASESCGGLLLVIDELGKFLEYAVQNNEDVYFYQQLAEAANRAPGKFIVVGVLHQAFEQYGAKLGRDIRDEWSKIQGRYIDIPLVSVSDEIVDLTGRAICADYSHTNSKIVAIQIAELIRFRKPSLDENFWSSLDKCWPLHPVTAALIGPVSRRRFGQNERSVFGFLVSVEPKGFKEFLLSNTLSEEVCYLPEYFWDYLKLNLEPAILASPDGHRWAQAAEAVERAEAKGDEIHIQIIKTIAVIELFKNGSGLLSDTQTILTCIPGKDLREVERVLSDLSTWSIIAYRKHLSSWGIFAGSDFDIDLALREALISIGDPDLKELEKLTNLYPVVAKRHYFTTGALRWMSIGLVNVNELGQVSKNFQPENDSFGSYLLAIPNRDTDQSDLKKFCQKTSKSLSAFPLVVGAASNGELIRELSRELLGLEYVRKNRPEHEGDPIARREITGRISAVRNQLEVSLSDAFITAHWFYDQAEVINPGIKGLSSVTSDFADKLYKNTPHVFSELLNREKLSSTTSKARRQLLHSMVLEESSKDLAFTGYPVEAGLYHVLLKSVGIHRCIDGEYRFCKPDQDLGSSFINAWNVAENLVLESAKDIKLSDLLDLWARPPFGIKAGVQPVLAIAFILANKHRIAIYKNKVFIPEMNDTVIDEVLQDFSRFTLKYVEIDQERESILAGISCLLKEKLNVESNTAPLDAARALVAIMFNLPLWSQRTNKISTRARQIRDLLLRASDPHKVLFVDLPIVFGTDNAKEYVEFLGDALSEITNAYDIMLEGLMSKMLSALDADSEDYNEIKRRASIVEGISGDFRIDGFTARLALFEKRRSFYEGLLGLAVNKPSREWNDQDVDLALITLAEWALKFRQIEALASIQNRAPSRQAMAVVFGTGELGETIYGTFDISTKDQKVVDQLAHQLVTQNSDQKTDIFLAALAQVGANLLHLKGKHND